MNNLDPRKYKKEIKWLEGEIEQLRTQLFTLQREKASDKAMHPLEEKIKHYKRSISYINDPGRFYNHKYLMRHFRDYRKFEKALGRDITTRYNIKSLVDFGCGCGSYLEGAKELGARVKGFELMYDVIKTIIPAEILQFIKFGDAMEAIDCEQFDCAISIETAEHILEQRADAFIDNIVNTAKRLIFFTAAKPGQGGAGHINLQKKDYWIKKFKERGCRFNEEETKKTQDIWTSILDEKQKYIHINLIILQKHDC